jgi:hypothetical protein
MLLRGLFEYKMLDWMRNNDQINCPGLCVEGWSPGIGWDKHKISKIRNRISGKIPNYN